MSTPFSATAGKVRERGRTLGHFTETTSPLTGHNFIATAFCGVGSFAEPSLNVRSRAWTREASRSAAAAGKIFFQSSFSTDRGRNRSPERFHGNNRQSEPAPLNRSEEGSALSSGLDREIISRGGDSCSLRRGNVSPRPQVFPKNCHVMSAEKHSLQSLILRTLSRKPHLTPCDLTPEPPTSQHLQNLPSPAPWLPPTASP